MTDAPVGFIEKPPTVAASRSKAKKKGCSCEGSCKRLSGDYQLLRQRLENHLAGHQLEEDAKKPKVWTYKCSIAGCPQLVEVVGGIQAGQTLKCPTHGVVPLTPVL